jgi:hypothetical protein
VVTEASIDNRRDILGYKESTSTPERRLVGIGSRLPTTQENRCPGSSLQRDGRFSTSIASIIGTAADSLVIQPGRSQGELFREFAVSRCTREISETPTR